MNERRISGSIRAGSTDPAVHDALREQTREAMAHWASGVTIVAAQDGPVIHAVTVTAFMSVSLDPPLAAIGLGGNASVLPALTKGQRFGISILAASQRRIASMFTDPAPIGREVFDTTDVPLVKNALVTLTCSVEERIYAGDHTLIVAAVERVGGDTSQPPLVRWARGYRELGRRGGGLGG